MSEYSALMFLSEAAGRRLRMGDLALASALSLSGMSRIVDRLEARGLSTSPCVDLDRGESAKPAFRSASGLYGA
jgi:hypothetical protein